MQPSRASFHNGAPSIAFFWTHTRAITDRRVAGRGDRMSDRKAPLEQHGEEHHQRAGGDNHASDGDRQRQAIVVHRSTWPVTTADSGHLASPLHVMAGLVPAIHVL